MSPYTLLLIPFAAAAAVAFALSCVVVFTGELDEDTQRKAYAGVQVIFYRVFFSTALMWGLIWAVLYG